MKSLLKEFFNDAAEVAGFMWQRGWAEGNAGNISFNITEHINTKIPRTKTLPVYKLKKKYEFLRNSFIWLTAAGARMQDLSGDIPNNSLIVNILDDGKSYRVLNLSDIFRNYKKPDNIINPTSELPTHLAVHNFLVGRAMKEKIILHTHPTELIALTQIKEYKSGKKINNILWGMHPEIKIVLPDGISFVPYTPPGSEKIAELTIKSFEQHKAVVWEKHGCISISDNIVKAFDIIDIIAKSTKVYFLCRSAGFNPEGLKD